MRFLWNLQDSEKIKFRATQSGKIGKKQKIGSVRKTLLLQHLNLLGRSSKYHALGC